MLAPLILVQNLALKFPMRAKLLVKDKGVRIWIFLSLSWTHGNIFEPQGHSAQVTAMHSATCIIQVVSQKHQGTATFQQNFAKCCCVNMSFACRAVSYSQE